MEAFLVKIFATALAFSQVTTAPDAIKTQFDRTRDQEQVAKLLHAGCTHVRKTFDIEGINLDDLITTALDDPQAITNETQLFRGINFADLQAAYRQFCKDQRGVVQAVDLGEVIDYYNKAAADLPDHTKLKGLKLPGGERGARWRGPALCGGVRRKQASRMGPSRRHPAACAADVHCGRGSAFLLARWDRRARADPRLRRQSRPGRAVAGRFDDYPAAREEPPGGRRPHLYSEDPRDDRRPAGRAHTVQGGNSRTLPQRGLFGRGAWGIEMGARAYFSKSANELTLRKARFCHADQGIDYFNPDRHPGRARNGSLYFEADARGRHALRASCSRIAGIADARCL